MKENVCKENRLIGNLPSIATSSYGNGSEGAGELFFSTSPNGRPRGVNVCETTFGFFAARPLPPRGTEEESLFAGTGLRTTVCGLAGLFISGLSVGAVFPRAMKSPGGGAWPVEAQNHQNI